MAEEGRTSMLSAVDYFEVTFVVGHTALLPESTRWTTLEYLKTVAPFFLLEIIPWFQASSLIHWILKFKHSQVLKY